MSAQCSEIGCSLRHCLVEELEGQSFGYICSEVKLKENVL